MYPGKEIVGTGGERADLADRMGEQGTWEIENEAGKVTLS